jgi:hypothetical protein
VRQPLHGHALAQLRGNIVRHMEKQAMPYAYWKPWPQTSKTVAHEVGVFILRCLRLATLETAIVFIKYLASITGFSSLIS